MGETAQHISKVNRGELLNILNVAFSEEWLAYYQYWIGAQVAKGPMRKIIAEEFIEHANEELKHAQWLSDRIIQLDEYVETLLRQNLTAERCAVARYQQICDMCYGKDYDTFRVSAKILKEELEHEQEIGDYIDDIEETKKHMRG